jgi:hypothetical protein
MECVRLSYGNRSCFWVRWFTFQWTVPAVVILGVLVATWYMRRGGASSTRVGDALMLAVSWASLFFASELSYPLWLISTPLRLVQFPHRFTHVTSATGPIANLLVCWDLRQRDKALWRTMIAALPLVLGFTATMVLSAKFLIIDGKPYHLAVDETKPYSGLPEYTLASAGPHWLDYYRRGGLTAECSEKALVCRTVETNSRVQGWDISAGQPAHLRLPLFDFPAWRVTIDGKSAPTVVDAETGLISLDLPAATHRVTALWTRLAVERLGVVITGLMALVLAALAAAPRMRRFVRPVARSRAPARCPQIGKGIRSR